MFYIEVAQMKKDDEPLIMTISKEDMLKVPSELHQSEFNHDHGIDKENEDNDDNGASKTDTIGENEDYTKSLLRNATDNIASKLGTYNDVYAHAQAHVRYGKAEEIDIATMNSFDTEKVTILDAVRNLSRKDRRHPRITLLDFGGQSMYYAFHQIFLSPKTFYILVLDMSKSLDEKVNETEDTCGGQFEFWTYKGMLNNNTMF